jgi:hypothetical protein
MTIPNDLLPLATTQSLLVFLSLALVLVAVVTEEIGTGIGKAFERRHNIGTLLQHRRLLFAFVELLLLLLPFRVEQFDSDVLGKFGLGDEL